MTYKQIQEMSSRRDTLTEAEEIALANGILKNKRAREEAIEGALQQGNVQLAFALMTNNVIIRVPEK